MTTAAELFEAIDNEIIAAGGTDRITFTVLLDNLVGQRVEIAGVQRQAGRLPELLLRTLAPPAPRDPTKPGPRERP